MSEDLTSKLEFEIKDLSEASIKSLEKALASLNGVHKHDYNKTKNTLYVEANIATSVLHEHIEKATNSLVVLKGIGNLMDSGVAEINSEEHRDHHPIRGVIRFVQIDFDNCAIDGTVDGLSPGDHALTIFENGDLSKGFGNLGGHFNPTEKKHGLYKDAEKHIGDLGNINADLNGRASFRFVDKDLKLWDVIGRSVCISEKPECRSSETGKKLACGIIARSSRIFDNVKKICLCSGKTLWEERSDVLQNS